MLNAVLDMPEVEQPIRLRGQRLVAAIHQNSPSADGLAVARLPGQALVQLNSMSDGDLGEELFLPWEVEPCREQWQGRWP